jgi:hypothetical protein
MNYLLMAMLLTSCVPDLSKCPDTVLVLDGSVGESEVDRMKKAATISCSFQGMCLAQLTQTKAIRSRQCKKLK